MQTQTTPGRRAEDAKAVGEILPHTGEEHKNTAIL